MKSVARRISIGNTNPELKMNEWEKHLIASVDGIVSGTKKTTYNLNK